MAERRRWRRAGSAAAGLVALGVLLAGCVGIPTSGDVSIGDAIEEGQSGVEFFPVGPNSGATQEEILRGFVDAASSSGDDYKVAREFLASGFADGWNPRTGVIVRSSAQRVAAADGGALEYTVNAEASVDESGSYRIAGAPTPRTLRFAFVQEDGEWRISEAADGIVLSDVVFRATFDPHALYFLEPTGARLVPDLRWYPGGSAALRIVSGLLDGPPSWLTGAVRSAFPDGTALAAPRVQTDSGTAVVELTSEALAASGSDRSLMLAQLSASLTGVANVRQVSISVGGVALTIPENGGSAPQTDPLVDPRPIALVGGRFGYLAGRSVSSLGDLAAQVVDSGPRGATVADDGDVAAVLGAAGVSVVRASAASPVLVDPRPGLVVPSVDDYGWVWSSTSSTPAALIAVDSAGTAVPIETGLPSDAGIVSLDVSLDGARLAILASTPAGPRLLVTSIKRDSTRDQRPIGLSEPIVDSTVVNGVAVDATWSDALTVAVLTLDGDVSSVTAVEVGGDISPLGDLERSVTIVGGNGESNLRVLGADGTVIERNGTGWSDTGVPVLFLASQR